MSTSSLSDFIDPNDAPELTSEEALAALSAAAGASSAVAPVPAEPSVSDAELEAQRALREKQLQELREKQEQEQKQREDDESAQRAKTQANHTLRRAVVLQEDQQLIDSASEPIRSYLMQAVIPALVDGLLDVCKMNPDDPVDYLAEYLFKYSVAQPMDPENSQERPKV